VEDVMENLFKRALELGAEKAKIIDTETVVVGEWVRWKCLYGCPMYAKDGFHPPIAPDAESTKRVLREYTKAILLNGPNGMTLTEAAVKLEGEAYHRGYYKAFALTALVPVGGTACAPPGPGADPAPGGT
jgi:predicted metal-binding protein